MTCKFGYIAHSALARFAYPATGRRSFAVVVLQREYCLAIIINGMVIPFFVVSTNNTSR